MREGPGEPASEEADDIVEHWLALARAALGESDAEPEMRSEEARIPPESP